MARWIREWRTLSLIVFCYGLWGVALFWLWSLVPVVSILALILACALHGSLSHEILHGHPFANKRINDALVFLPLSLFFPYQRFRDLHLAHHQNSALTDPYDDPESNYMDPAVWHQLGRFQQRILRLNNTLAGRIVLGPAVGQVCFMRAEMQLLAQGDRAVLRAWGLHGLGLIGVLWLIVLSPSPVWAALLGAYGGAGVIKMRTFLEHRAHEAQRARTVIIEDKGPLALLFLNNNLHVVHHMHPNLPWHALPAAYARNKAYYQRVNQGYVYPSYGAIIRQYLWQAKDPVPHPLWPQE